MEILALVESEDHVCTRYRISAYREHLAKAGYSIRYVNWPKSLVGMINLVSKVRGRTVLLQRKLPPTWLTWLLRRSCSRLIFDFDDAIFLRDSYSKKGLDDQKRLSRFAAVSKAADAIVAGNQFLADSAIRYANPASVMVIPTVIDTSRYPEKPRPNQSDSLEMVWIGSSSTLQSLEIIRPILETIGKTFDGISLKVICDSFPSFENLRITQVRWEEDREVEEISGSQLGICFMPDDRWSRGKCGLKLLQYMAAGLPVIANPVGVHVEIINHNQNGFLATTCEEWVSAIRSIYKSKEQQMIMGANGRKIVEASYSVCANAGKWVNLLDKLDDQKLQAG